MSFPLLPKSVTLNDLELRIMALTLRYFTEFSSFRGALCKGKFIRVRCRRKKVHVRCIIS